MGDIDEDVKKAKAGLNDKTAVTPGLSRAFTFSITLHGDDEEDAKKSLSLMLEDPRDVGQFSVKETSE